MREKRRSQIWRRTVLCFAAMVVFATTYALILPAITLEKRQPSISAELLTAESGETSEVVVHAFAGEDTAETVFVLTAQSENAGLSLCYSFDEEGAAVVLDSEGKELLLYRSVRENTENTVDYHFILARGQKTEFTLELSDQLDISALIADIEEYENGEAERHTASVSDAEKVKANAQSEIKADRIREEQSKKNQSQTEWDKENQSQVEQNKEYQGGKETEGKKTEKTEQAAKRATASDTALLHTAEKASRGLKKAASRASAANALKDAGLQAETTGEGSAELEDGEVLNDLPEQIGEAEKKENAEGTREVSAELVLSVGSGDSLEKAVRDAEKNAEKRGDARLTFTWLFPEEKLAEEMKVLRAEGEGFAATLSYGPEAELPEDAVLSARELAEDSEEYRDCLLRAEEAISEEEESVISTARFFDLTIMSGGTEVEPKAPVEVQLNLKKTDMGGANKEATEKTATQAAPRRSRRSLPESPEGETGEAIQSFEAAEEREIPMYGESALSVAYGASTSELQALHFKDDGSVESIALYADALSGEQLGGVETTSVRFSAESFSIYAIMETEPDANQPNLWRRYEFYDYAGNYYGFTNREQVWTYVEEVASQGTLYNPGTPTPEPVVQGKQLEFIGWYEKKLNGDWADQATLKPDGKSVRIDVVDKNETVKLYARYVEEYYLIYYDERGHIHAEVKTGDKDNVSLLKGDGTPAVSYQPNSDINVFLGWAENDTAVAPVNTVNIPSDPGHVNLYPVLAEVRWISFDKNDEGSEQGLGATYSAPIYVIHGRTVEESIEKLPEPERRGYRFDGWYTEETLQTRYQLNNAAPHTLPDDITLYAKWTPVEVNYTINLWKQRLDAGVKPETGAVNPRDYDFMVAIPGKAVTGTQVSVPWAYWHYQNGQKVTIGGVSYDFTGLHYRGRDGTKTVKADGSTVLNVYYNRNVITITFNAQRQIDPYENSPYRYILDEQTGGYAQTVTYQGLYEAPLSFSWPTRYYRQISQYGGTWENTLWGYPNGDGSYTTLTYTGNFILPTPTDTSISLIRSVPGTVPVRFYTQVGVENVDNVADVNNLQWKQENEIFTKGGGFSISDKLTGFRAYQYRTYKRTYYGYQWSDWIDLGEKGTNGIYAHVDAGYRELEIRYARKKYKLTFEDSFDAKLLSDSILNTGQIPDEVVYGGSLSVYGEGGAKDANRLLKDISHTGYRFTGWYKDPACQDPFDFNAQMPASNLIAYAGWEKYRYRVWIQPNGGELSDTESTYFYTEWGDRIPEYADIRDRRGYYEAKGGEYSYVILPNEEPRKAYYKKTAELTTITGVTDAGKPYTYDEHNFTDGKAYKEQAAAYKFVGWYKVEEAIQEDRPPEILESDALTLWKFDTPVTENIALRAIWKRHGVLRVEYDPQMEGTSLVGSNAPEKSGYVYGDRSNAEVGHAPTPPAGYVFAGWRTPAGRLLQPKDIFTIYSSLAREDPQIGDQPQFTFVLTAVYEQIGTTSITYHANGGLGDLTNLGAQLGNDHLETSQIVNRISNLVLNAPVRLSDGSGFYRTGHVLLGWNDDQDAATQGEVKFTLGAVYGADDEKGNDLYAVWAPTILDINFSKYGLQADGSEVPLSGAKFALFASEDSAQPSQEAVSSADGTVLFENIIPQGDHLVIREVSAPDDY